MGTAFTCFQPSKTMDSSYVHAHMIRALSCIPSLNFSFSFHFFFFSPFFLFYFCLFFFYPSLFLSFLSSLIRHLSALAQFLVQLVNHLFVTSQQLRSLELKGGCQTIVIHAETLHEFVDLTLKDDGFRDFEGSEFCLFANLGDILHDGLPDVRVL
eukprot:m.9507 g.9507  ORF g.9507 m.9507 type:complete len:155 (+) comp7209_c0_seq1:857-1321(+)